MPAPPVSVLLGGVGNSLAGVIGKESVPDDREVERDARVEANGVVSREDVVLVCMQKDVWNCKGRVVRLAASFWTSLSVHFRRIFSRVSRSSREPGS